MKNIVLFGGSNSVMVNGLQAGLKEYANLTNLALGSSASTQNLFETLKDKNKEILANTDLIVTESIVNEVGNHNWSPENLPLETIFRNLQWFYTLLYKNKKPVCVIILPEWGKNGVKISNFHRFFANYFGFALIDMINYYEKYEVITFGKKFGAHQMALINRNLGKNIAKNIDKIGIPNKAIDNLSLPEFKIITPSEMEKHGEIKIFNPKNSMFDEVVYRLEKGNYLSLKAFSGYKIIGLHAWNLDSDGAISRKSFGDSLVQCASIFIGDKNTKMIKQTAKLNQFCEIQAELLINDDYIVKFNHEDLANTEYYHAAFHDKPNTSKVPYFDIISLLLMKPFDFEPLIKLDNIPDDKIIETDPELDFSHLIPNIEFFRDSMEFIDEYIAHLYPQIRKDIENSLLTPLKKRLEALENKLNEKEKIIIDIKNYPDLQKIRKDIENTLLNPLKARIKVLEKELGYYTLTATERIQNQLSYKLGKAMIENSKSFKDYLKLPFILYKIKKAHKVPLNQPKIESLPDYKEALKLKNHLSYKLGQALIKANKFWFCGGYIWLMFEIQKIKKNHKK